MLTVVRVLGRPTGVHHPTVTVFSCRTTRQQVVPPEERDAEHAGEEKISDKKIVDVGHNRVELDCVGNRPPNRFAFGGRTDRES